MKCIFQGIHLMYEQLSALNELSERHSTLITGANSLEDKLLAWKMEVESDVNSVIKRTPFDLRMGKTPTQIDNEDPPCPELPPPITPQVLLLLLYCKVFFIINKMFIISLGFCKIQTKNIVSINISFFFFY